MSSEPPLRVLIVDDEPLAQRRLEQLLAPKEDVEITGFADRGREAIQLIAEAQPDLVFLDVQMPGLTGVDVIREVGPEHMPPVIFVTAYDQYALDAFELAALDYLVKPFDSERFEAAFQRARKHVRLQEKGQTADQLLALLESGKEMPEMAERQEEDDYLKRIAVETPGRMRVISIDQIDYITADGSYAELHVGEKVYPVREKMKTLTERLDPSAFFRIHRSTIVRLDCIASLLKGGGGQYAVELEDGTRLRVSRSRHEQLQERLGITL